MQIHDIFHNCPEQQQQEEQQQQSDPKDLGSKFTRSKIHKNRSQKVRNNKASLKKIMRQHCKIN